MIRAKSGFAVQAKQAPTCAFLERKLRDQFLGQFKIEFFGSHAAHYIDGGKLPGLLLETEIPIIALPCRDGGIGRRTGLKIPRPHRRAGSIPAPGTTE